MSIQYPTFTFIGSSNETNEAGKKSTNLLQDDASILIHFASADGRMREMPWAGLHKSFLAVHGPAVGHYDRIAREGSVKVGSVMPLTSRKGQPGEKTILVVATRQNAEDPHDLEAIRKALRNIHGWLLSQEDQTKQVALAYPAGPLCIGTDENGKAIVLRRNKAWAEIGKLFGQYLDTVEQVVRVYIGRGMDQFYADRVVSARAPQQADAFLPEYNDLDEAYDAKAVQQASQAVDANDPFLPEYEDLDSEPEYSQVEVVDDEVEEEQPVQVPAAVAKAMQKHPELAEAFGDYDATNKAIKHATR